MSTSQYIVETKATPFCSLRCPRARFFGLSLDGNHMGWRCRDGDGDGGGVVMAMVMAMAMAMAMMMVVVV